MNCEWLRKPLYCTASVDPGKIGIKNFITAFARVETMSDWMAWRTVGFSKQ
jgi:hypothetical protein